MENMSIIHKFCKVKLTGPITLTHSIIHHIGITLFTPDIELIPIDVKDGTIRFDIQFADEIRIVNELTSLSVVPFEKELTSDFVIASQTVVQHQARPDRGG